MADNSKELNFNETKNKVFKFNVCDSFAVWDFEPNQEFNNLTQLERNLYMRNHIHGIYPEKFTKKLKERTDEEWKAAMAKTKYVIIGLNPGNRASNNPADKANSGTVFGDKPFLNFHGENVKYSKDYNMAAAIYSTPVYGENTLMTDAFENVESNSPTLGPVISQNKIEIFQKLYDHFDELGIPANAGLIFCHSQLRDKLKTKAVQKALAQRTIVRPAFDAELNYIPHYSYISQNVKKASEKARATIERLVASQNN